MSTQHRRRATDIANLPVPKLPQVPPKDWPPGLYQVLRDLLRSLEISNEVIFGIQDAGSKKPLRSDLNFIGASVTDNLVNDRTDVSIGGGAGAAPVNATYIVVALNGTLTNERVLVAGAGMTSTDGGANGNFTMNVVGGFGITVGADVVDWNGVTMRKNSGANVGTRRRINLIEGVNIAITEVDDAPDDEIDTTIAVTPTYAHELMLMGG